MAASTPRRSLASPSPPLPVRLRAYRHKRAWLRRETWFHWLGGDEGLPMGMARPEARAVAEAMLVTQLGRARGELGDALLWGLGAPHPAGIRSCSSMLCEHRRAFAVAHAPGLLPASAVYSAHLGPLVDPVIELVGLPDTMRDVLDHLARTFPGTLSELLVVVEAVGA